MPEEWKNPQWHCPQCGHPLGQDRPQQQRRCSECHAPLVFADDSWQLVPRSQQPRRTLDHLPRFRFHDAPAGRIPR
jgi:hypothetical protein